MYNKKKDVASKKAEERTINWYFLFGLFFFNEAVSIND